MRAFSDFIQFQFPWILSIEIFLLFYILIFNLESCPECFLNPIFVVHQSCFFLYILYMILEKSSLSHLLVHLALHLFHFQKYLLIF
jgi:hypothetical protein